MIDRVIEFLKKYELDKKTIIVGFSGGNDSMCLLDILSKISNLKEFWEMKVIAAHFNHNWRGEESLKEQEICRLYATSKGFEFYTQTASPDLKKTENDARIARYEFFEEAADVMDADAVLTAHNKDDNAETILYRIAKGTGLVGLKGIAENRGIYYRPFLNTSRAEIEAYCNKHHLTPNQDSSNNDIKYKRNLIRLEILPALKKVNPQVMDALNKLSDVIINEENIMNEYLSPIREKVFKDDTLVPEVYINLSKPVKMHFIHEYVQILGLDYDSKKINEMFEFIEKNISQRNGSTLSLTASRWLYVDEKTIEPIPRIHETPVSEICLSIEDEGEYNIGNKVLTIKPFIDNEMFVFPEATSSFVYVDLSKQTFPLTIRTRRDGDIINPFGMTGSMKLKKYLNSKGISKHKRDEVLLLTNNEEVLWAVGVGISNKIGVVQKPTHVIELR